MQSSLSMHAATVMGVLVNCRRVRGAVWAAGGASALLPTLATASPQALRGECSCPLHFKAVFLTAAAHQESCSLCLGLAV